MIFLTFSGRFRLTFSALEVSSDFEAIPHVFQGYDATARFRHVFNDSLAPLAEEGGRVAAAGGDCIPLEDVALPASPPAVDNGGETPIGALLEEPGGVSTPVPSELGNQETTGANPYSPATSVAASGKRATPSRSEAGSEKLTKRRRKKVQNP